MSAWQITLVFAGIMVSGFVRQYFTLRSHRKQAEFACAFLCKFIEWCDGQGKNNVLYNWILGNSEKIQNVIGYSGLMDMRRPFENAYHTNVPIILNLIPDIYSTLNNDDPWRNSILRRNLVFSIQSVDGCLRRYIGSKEEKIRHEQLRLFNPFVWFGGGIAWLMELPLSVLSEVGGISSERKIAIARGRIFSLAKGIVSIASLISIIMAFVLDWEEFMSTILQWIMQIRDRI